MKRIIQLAIIALSVSCSHPIRVTTKVDERNATSGTLGSAHVENSARRPVDTTLRKSDTLKINRNNL